MFSEVDEVDRRNLACIFGRNIGGTAPVHLPIPRMRQLLAYSEHLIALVDDADKVLALIEKDTNASREQFASRDVPEVPDAVACL